MTATPTAQTDPDPLVGRVLQGRYRITRLIGQGGMGAVYAAQHLSIGNTVAIKVLHAKYAKEPGVVARFRREAQATTHIRHHNIVGMFDLGELEDGALYLVMEHLDGRDWSSDLEKEGPQPLAKVIHVLTQVCDALGAAHEAGIVHRDIKPDNIYLVRRSGDPSFVKVVDFGISKVHGAAAELAPSLTQTGAALGTPYYMAPEQVHGRKDIDARTDIYALGIVMFQALTGRYPFDGETYPMLVMNIVAQPIAALATYRPDLPAELQPVLERMVAKDRADRYGSAAEVKAALRPFANVSDEPSRAVPPSAPALAAQSEVREIGRAPTPSPAPTRSTPWLALGVIGALALAGVGAGVALAVWSAGPSGGDDPPAVQPESVTPEAVEVHPATATDTNTTTAAPGADTTAIDTSGSDVAQPVEPSAAAAAATAETTEAQPQETAAPSAAQEPDDAERPTRRVRRARETVVRPVTTPVPPPVAPARTPRRVGTNDAPILE